MLVLYLQVLLNTEIISINQDYPGKLILNNNIVCHLNLSPPSIQARGDIGFLAIIVVSRMIQVSVKSGPRISQTTVMRWLSTIPLVDTINESI